MKRWRATFAIGCAAVAGVAIACGPGFLDGISGGHVDGGDEAAPPPPSDAGDDAPLGCVSAVPPERPDAADNVENVTMLLAFEYIRADTQVDPDASGPPPKGLDLDRTCTCTAPQDSCVRSKPEPICDGPNGADNAVARLLQVASAAQVFSPTFVTDAIREGRFTILAELRGWNGLPDDPSVTVNIRLAGEMDRLDGGRERPRFDGRDLWAVDPQSIFGGDDAGGLDCRNAAVQCQALVFDTKAYVTGGQLVARPDPSRPVRLTIPTTSGPIRFDLADFVLTGALSAQDGGSYRLDGEIAGRISAEQYLTMVANLRIGTLPICKSPLFEGGFRPEVCDARDIAAAGKDGIGAPCDHLSGAFSFGASPAKAGRVVLQDAEPPPCGDETFRCP
ncbi:MAG: hypothetical protein KIT84_11950 [Labilithrix sp.]|nr:hypothetical protein [Labilithrix sp.]MCW5811724.1 hypothetical protein [Labilithrix sp.]